MRYVRAALCALVLCGAGCPQSAAQDGGCGGKRTCRDMATCAEANHYLKTCGVKSLDGDGDGIPCESICGQDSNTMAARLKAQPFAPAPGFLPAGVAGIAAQGAAPTPLGCGSKRTCTEMTSCEEARFYLGKCGVKSLDRDADGIPCKGLCR